MALQAVGSKIIIKKDSNGDKTKASGIIIPESVQEVDAEKATVISVGDGRASDSGARVVPLVKNGDKIYVNRFAGQKITHDTIEYIAISEEDIIAIEK